MRAVLALSIVIVAASGEGAGADDGEASGGYEKGTIGVGIAIGEPTGICARLYLENDQAIQGAVGAAFLGGGIQAHADYAFHPYVLQKRESFVLATYIGPGLRVMQYRDGDRGDNTFAIGLRAVGGLLFDFNNPLDAFVEVAGVAEYEFEDTEGFGLALNAAAGVRYYF